MSKGMLRRGSEGAKAAKTILSTGTPSVRLLCTLLKTTAT